MGCPRNGHRKEIYDLGIGAEMVIAADVAKHAPRVLSRLKGWASKIPDRSYRMRLAEDAIHIQRTPLGMNGRLADWQMMRAGTRLLLKRDPLRADELKAKKIADYLTSTKKQRQLEIPKTRYDHWSGIWSVYREPFGPLYALCTVDLQGNDMMNPDYRTWPIRHLWAGEWK